MSEKDIDEIAGEEAGQVADNGEQSLDQIREILFGTQTRDIDARFDGLSQHFSESLDGLRSLIREHFDALTQQLENEVQKLRNELHKAQHEIREQNANLEGKQQASANSLREQIGSLRELLNTAEQGLRGESEQGLNGLREQLSSDVESLRSQFQQSVEQVAQASVTRRSFGEALRELSARFDDN